MLSEDVKAVYELPQIIRNVKNTFNICDSVKVNEKIWILHWISKFIICIWNQSSAIIFCGIYLLSYFHNFDLNACKRLYFLSVSFSLCITISRVTLGFLDYKTNNFLVVILITYYLIVFIIKENALIIINHSYSVNRLSKFYLLQCIYVWN